MVAAATVVAVGVGADGHRQLLGGGRGPCGECGVLDRVPWASWSVAVLPGCGWWAPTPTRGSSRPSPPPCRVPAGSAPGCTPSRNLLATVPKAAGACGRGGGAHHLRPTRPPKRGCPAAPRRRRDPRTVRPRRRAAPGTPPGDILALLRLLEEHRPRLGLHQHPRTAASRRPPHRPDQQPRPPAPTTTEVTEAATATTAASVTSILVSSLPPSRRPVPRPLSRRFSSLTWPQGPGCTVGATWASRDW